MATTQPIPTHPRFQDLTKMPPFGCWTVFGYAGKKGAHAYWLCCCECGTEKLVSGTSLKSGSSTQCCACARKSMPILHGSCGTPTYKSWIHMIQRCENSRDMGFENYGGRGIKVCFRWRNSFEAFLTDMGPRPSKKHSIDRFPDSNGDYEPGNCRWATAKEQNRNRRGNRLLTFNGKTQCIADWADELGINASTIRNRIHRGASDKSALLKETDQI